MPLTRSLPFTYLHSSARATHAHVGVVCHQLAQAGEALCTSATPVHRVTWANPASSSVKYVGKEKKPFVEGGAAVKLISFGSPHVQFILMGRTCGEPNEQSKK